MEREREQPRRRSRAAAHPTPAPTPPPPTPCHPPLTPVYRSTSPIRKHQPPYEPSTILGIGLQQCPRGVRFLGGCVCFLRARYPCMASAFQGAGLMAQGLWCRVPGCRVQGAGCRVQGAAPPPTPRPPLLDPCVNNYCTKTCSGSEKGSYLRLIDICITQL